MAYRPSRSGRCQTGHVAGSGSGTVLGLFVSHVRCADGERLVRAYQACLERRSGRDGGCFGAPYRRCFDPPDEG